ncbi:hypothetical protein J5N97_005734 [Dioscorea zingiberensis]|uniref:Syntaxin N-terminal domain-containing protein n=1 Tax=Dioscorea zingiberensis TaxID=325984 RepID=A0A9D5HSL6_9LILI|nr:hypothetical protein J5N97_005734 [Dioscorea zingiberensis]
MEGTHIPVNKSDYGMEEFFKQDKEVEKLIEKLSNQLQKLQEANEESKSVTKASAMKGAGRVTSFSPTASVEDLFQKYMNGHDPGHDFSDAERERILRTLNNIKMRNSHYNPDNDEILGLQQELRAKREELSSLKDQLSKYQPKENEVIRSAHGHLARERLLAQTLERVQQRLSFLYQNDNSLEDSSQQPVVHNYHMALPDQMCNQELLENWKQSQLMLMPTQGESSSNYQKQSVPQIYGWPGSSSNNQGHSHEITELLNNPSNHQMYEQFMNRETTTMPMSMNNMNDIGSIPIDVQR